MCTKKARYSATNKIEEENLQIYLFNFSTYCCRQCIAVELVFSPNIVGNYLPINSHLCLSFSTNFSTFDPGSWTSVSLKLHFKSKGANQFFLPNMLQQISVIQITEIWCKNSSIIKLLFEKNFFLGRDVKPIYKCVFVFRYIIRTSSKIMTPKHCSQRSSQWEPSRHALFYWPMGVTGYSMILLPAVYRLKILKYCGIKFKILRVRNCFHRKWQFEMEWPNCQVANVNMKQRLIVNFNHELEACEWRSFIYVQDKTCSMQRVHAGLDMLVPEVEIIFIKKYLKLRTLVSKWTDLFWSRWILEKGERKSSLLLLFLQWHSWWWRGDNSSKVCTIVMK